MESDAVRNSVRVHDAEVMELHDIYVGKIEEAYKAGEIDSNLYKFLWGVIRSGYLEGRRKYEPGEEERILDGLEIVLDYHMKKIFPDYEEKVSPFADDPASEEIAKKSAEDLKRSLREEIKKHDRTLQ